jgi:hypothetical protein
MGQKKGCVSFGPDVVFGQKKQRNADWNHLLQVCWRQFTMPLRKYQNYRHQYSSEDFFVLISGLFFQ